MTFINYFFIIIFMKKENANLITKDMTIKKVLEIDETLADVLMGFGMHCIFCPMSQMETLQEAAQVHEIDVDFLIKKLNENVKKRK